MKNKSDRDMGRRLKIARLTLNLSEKEMAAAIGVTALTYQKYEKGDQARSFQGTVNFCFEHKIDIDWLLSGYASSLDKSLASHAPGKVAILPVVTLEERQRRARAAARAAAYWQNRAGVQS